MPFALVGLWACFASAAVTVVGDSGNPLTNGVNFRNALNNADCGDSIVLQAGVIYRSPDSVDQPIRFPAKSTPACSADNPAWITIQSSASGNLPEGVRVSLSDEPHMAILDTPHSWGPVEFLPGAHHYRFIGILFTTAPNLTHQNRFSNVLVSVNAAAGNAPWPHHLWFDRCIARPFEATTGEHFRSAARGFQVDGQDIWITNSYIYGFTGFSTDHPKVSVSTGSPGITPVLTATANHNYSGNVDAYIFGGIGEWVRANGIHRVEVESSTSIRIRKLIGLVTVTGATARVRMYMDRVHNLQVNDRVTIAGFVSPGTELNGLKTITAVPSPYEFEMNAVGAAQGTYCPIGHSCRYAGNSSVLSATWDASTAGPYTGSASYWRRAVPPNTGGIYIIGSPGPHHILNNYLEGWFATIFTGGGGLATSNMATLSSASSTQAVFSNVANLQVGDLVGVNVSGSGRTVKVTAINGNVVSYTSFGPGGIGSATPDTPGLARWRGVNGPYIIVRRNILHMPADQQYVGICKTFSELKLVDGGVFDGNIYTGTQSCPILAITSRNQKGGTPWGVTRNLTYSNNLALAGGRIINAEDDDLMTQVTAVDAPPDGGSGGGDNMRFINNLILNVSAGDVPVSFGGTGFGSEFKHNTITTQGASRIGGSVGCNPTLTPPRGIIRASMMDNIVEHGDYGFVSKPGGFECWPAKATRLVNNVVVDNKNVGAGVVISNVPGNFYAANYTAMRMAGVCDAAGNNWENCRLSPGSPFKGTASDGGDPGVDIDMLRDHINGWSEQAGLILLTNENNPDAFQMGTTQAVMKFRTLNGACTLELYSNKARTQLHADTDAGLEQLCSRVGNMVNANGTVEFALGRNAPLSPLTTYYYRIVDGVRTMVGSFRTLGTETSGNTPCGTQTITFNTTIAGSLSASDCLARNGSYYGDRFTFNGVAGVPVAITHRSSNFDPFLILRSPSGSILEDDNSGGGLDARIPSTGMLTLPVTGTYTIEATSFGVQQTGSYTLRVDSTQTSTPPPAANSLRFVPITPCRVVDTRSGGGKSGAFGPPYLAGGTSRAFPLLSSGCGIAGDAAGYSLNITVAPRKTLAFLTVFPTGSPQPGTSTLNSFDGRTVANAAIVPAGSSGFVQVFATDDTELIIDINGYLVP